MAKITLRTASSGYQTTADLNQNFSDISSEFQNKVLYRVNPAGEPNQMENDLDMNSFKILNVKDATTSSGAVNYKQLQNTIAGASSGLIVRLRESRKIATAGQTIFNFVDITYSPSSNNLQVYVNGVAQVVNIDYTETSSTSITFTSGLQAGDYVDAYSNESTTSSVTDAQAVEYTASGTTQSVKTFLDSIGPLRTDLKSTDPSKGAALVGGVGRVVDSITALKALPKTGSNRAFVTGYYAAGDGGGGQYYYDAADTTSTDNGGSIIVAGDGGRWKLIQPREISVRQFGATGDSTTDDAAAIQAAIDWASRTVNTNGAVLIPEGYYYISTALKIPNYITLLGDADYGSVIYNQITAPSTPGQITNKDPANFVGATIKNISFLGSARSVDLNVTSSVANLRFEYCRFELQTDVNFYASKLLQTSLFIGCRFKDANYGLKVDGATTNLNNFIDCEFLSNGVSSVYLRSSEVNNFIGCRFEAGGNINGKTFDITDSANLIIKGAYFENTHKTLLSETGSRNSVTFDGCHFTGTDLGSGLESYNFVSDGVVNFGTNNWGSSSSDGPATILLTGANWNGQYVSGKADPQLGNTGKNTLYTAFSKQHKKIVSPWRAAPASLSLDLLHFNKPNIYGATSNLKALTGKLTVHYYGVTSGGFDQVIVKEYQVMVRSAGGGTMKALITQGTSAAVGSGPTLTVQQKSGATGVDLTIEGVFTGITPSTDIGSLLQWEFEYMHGSVKEEDYIEAQVV